MITEEEFNETYINATKASKILSLSVSRISRLCSGGRFEGAFKNGSSWIIPKVAVMNFTRLKRGVKPKVTDKEIALIAINKNNERIYKEAHTDE